MIRWLVALLALLSSLVVAVYFQTSQPRGGASFPAPEFRLPDLHGRTHQLSDYRGKIVFLNLWATWCPPCREEMPSMERLYHRLRDDEFVMLAISQDEQINEAVRPFVEQMRLSFPILLDPQGKVPPKYGVTGYPETFIIDRAGRVIDHIIGPRDWDSELSFRYFSSLLHPTDPDPQAAQ